MPTFTVDVDWIENERYRSRMFHLYAVSIQSAERQAVLRATKPGRSHVEIYGSFEDD